MTRAIVIAIVCATGAAHANVWQHAIDRNNDLDPGQERYDFQMRRADDALATANSRTILYRELKRQLGIVEDAYREAARAKPDAAEPYFRIGMVLNNFYIDCKGLSWQPLTCNENVQSIEVTKKIIEAWVAFEVRAPLDPRVTEILTQRAILRTKLVSSPRDTATLAAAIHDYEAYLDRTDGSGFYRSYIVLGNLAETYMMVGRLDDSIAMYDKALIAGAHVSTAYGLAVALDRDERGDSALERIRQYGTIGFEDYRKEFAAHGIFYVPPGEEYYYFALATEALGRYDESIQHWQAYIASGAHPEFQPRARQHLDTLVLKRKMRTSLGLPQLHPEEFFR